MIRVMLIDDVPAMRAGLHTILNSFNGVEVVIEGADGSEALGITTDEVDVVVCDIQLPGMDGITAPRRLKEAEGPPVLIRTTQDAESDIVAAIEAGALDHLLKDAPAQALHDAVLATARGKRTLAPEVAIALTKRLGKPHKVLSAQEFEILQALSTGANNRELGKILFISEATMKTHLTHIFQKLGVDTHTAAVTVARERKLI